MVAVGGAIGISLRLVHRDVLSTSAYTAGPITFGRHQKEFLWQLRKEAFLDEFVDMLNL